MRTLLGEYLASDRNPESPCVSLVNSSELVLAATEVARTICKKNNPRKALPLPVHEIRVTGVSTTRIIGTELQHFHLLLVVVPLMRYEDTNKGMLTV